MHLLPVLNPAYSPAYTVKVTLALSKPSCHSTISGVGLQRVVEHLILKSNSFWIWILPLKIRIISKILQGSGLEPQSFWEGITTRFKSRQLHVNNPRVILLLIRAAHARVGRQLSWTLLTKPVLSCTLPCFVGYFLRLLQQQSRALYFSNFSGRIYCCWPISFNFISQFVDFHKIESAISKVKIVDIFKYLSQYYTYWNRRSLNWN